MTAEIPNPQAQDHSPTGDEGEEYLRRFDAEEYANVLIQDKHGNIIEARDFLDICAEHARPVFSKIDAMKKDDPRRIKLEEGLKAGVRNYIESMRIDQPTQTDN